MSAEREATPENPRERREQLRHEEELRQFAYAVSHDLREPLRMVSSYSQLLSRRYDAQLDDEGREFLRFINEAVQRMDRMLRDLLGYSHQLHALDHPLSAVSAEGALEGVLLTLEKEIGESGAHVTHEPLPEITFDFGQLTQVFRQLIDNSVKFRGAAPPAIHISSEQTDDSVTFAVRDNGIGIDPRYHEQIFGVFKRLHRDEYPGTGMGLAIVKRIVKQHGGRVWVESEAGAGATFRFMLPQ
ncbi:MAG TPA: ATP-binding protein [Bryobacteraceae bacterium]|nr:ATP-binding protein [Bryobacteraceae bacterium]